MKPALVSAVVPSHYEPVRVTGRLLGRLARTGGAAVAAEIEVLTDTAEGLRPTGRITLARAHDLEPLNPEAAALIADEGNPDRAWHATVERARKAGR